MFVHGGLYVDTDFVSVRPIDELLIHLNRYGVILGAMGERRSTGDYTQDYEHNVIQPIFDLQCHSTGYNFSRTNTVPNALMVSKARHPFWLHFMSIMKERASFISPVDATGPDALYYALQRWAGIS